MVRFSESIVEDAALAWLDELGYAVLHGPDIGIGEPGAERIDPNYRDVILEGRLRQALVKLNPDLPPEALEDAYRKLTRVDAPSLIARNRAVHRMLVNGVTVEYARADGSIAGAQARVIDFDEPENNDRVAINQFTVAEGQHTRRPDVVLFVNGLPLAVIELKNAADENATIWSAFHQLETYQAQIPLLFSTNASLIVSDGTQARVGTLAAGREWFKPWRTITGTGDAVASLAELQVVLEGVFDKRRFLDLLRYFIVFEDEGAGKLIKKMAGYHQFHAVNVAVEETLRAAKARDDGESVVRQHGGDPGDRRVGVVWHTGPNGAGKSTLMNLMTGLLRPTRGSITMLGIPTYKPEPLFRKVGYCTQFDSFPRGLTGREFIKSFLLVHGFDRQKSDALTVTALEQVNLLEAADRKVAAYSKGMRQRIRLAQAIAHQPAVLILDEPLNGLDPMVRAETIALFRKLAADGLHLIISSHILHEVDMMSDRVVLVNNGYVVAEGNIHGVRDEMEEHPMQILIRCDKPAKLAAHVFDEDNVVEARLHQDRLGLFVRTRDADSFYLLLNRVVAEGEISIESIAPVDDDLNAVYGYLIGAEGGGS